MDDIHENCVRYGTEPDGYVNYVKGANIAGFIKVAKLLWRRELFNLNLRTYKSEQRRHTTINRYASFSFSKKNGVQHGIQTIKT